MLLALGVLAAPLAEAQTLPDVVVPKGSPYPATEGTTVVYTVALSPAGTLAPAGGATVNLTVSDATTGGDFLASATEGAKTVTIAAGQTSTTYSVPTVDDNQDEPGGSIALKIEPGTGYNKTTFAHENLVLVRDNDHPPASQRPRAKVKAGTSPVTEGTAATFTVTLTQAAPTEGLRIGLLVREAEGTDFVAEKNQGAGKSETVAAGQKTAH